MQFQREFGYEFELGFDISQFPELTDKSWHNDVCPSFYFRIEKKYLVLWVDFKDPERREFNGLRYTVVNAQNYGTDLEPEVYCDWESEPVIKTENDAEIVAYLQLNCC